VHAAYSRDEILGAYGEGSPAKPPQFREGVRHIESAATDVLLITLKKAERDYSPTTVSRLRDRTGPIPLGVTLDAKRWVADDPAVRAACQPRSHDRAVCP
jgi:hypothetical protein